MLGLETYVRRSGLERSLIELVKLRASYMNGCAYCVDMHTKNARARVSTLGGSTGVPEGVRPWLAASTILRRRTSADDTASFTCQQTGWDAVPSAPYRRRSTVDAVS